jgi:micrococcal nuclease
MVIMKKYSKKSISALIVVLFIAAGQTLWTQSGGEIRGERIIVSKVYDGDTIVVGRGWKQTTIRLIGVDTPETVHPDKPVQFYGLEASDFAKRSLLGKWVRLEFDAPNRPGGSIDHYGRTLAYVITEDGGNFDLELVRLGYGRAYTRFPFKYMNEFKAAEHAARAQGRGMWSQEKKAAGSNPETRGKIIGNIRSHIYHLHGQHGYDKVLEKNRVYFSTEEEALKAGYRKARN